MDIFDAISERWSCRDFAPDEVSDEDIRKILQAAVSAPSPLNTQPWEFVVVTNQGVKERIFAEAERCKNWALDQSGWKWLAGYRPEFLKSAPAFVAVVGDPKKSGVDMFMEGGPVGYQHACAAAIQNMLLSAHALGLGTLWFTFFEKERLRQILEIDPEKTPLAIVCLGKPAGEAKKTPRKAADEKTRYVR